MTTPRVNNVGIADVLGESETVGASDTVGTVDGAGEGKGDSVGCEMVGIGDGAGELDGETLGRSVFSKMTRFNGGAASPHANSKKVMNASNLSDSASIRM